ncbi:putative ABC transporter permease [Olsenella uli]|uniref:putative ABC transporter permease n=1 Tax=Olsenella uli TaxID=133926 RepID=UPI0024A829FB|nr:putative ABC transporter permease [Olsenella uli]
MFLTLLSLLFLLLVVRGFARVIGYFWTWLGHGRDLEHARARGRVTSEGSLPEEAEEVLSPRLTRRQRAQVLQSRREEREEFLDGLSLGWYQIVFIFVLGSMAGLLLEEVWMFATAGLTESRVGLVWGPFSPLYGTGTVLLTALSFWLRRKQARSWQIFLLSAIVGGSLEQLTGWGMETLFHAQSWTYAALPDHITTWVAWRFLVFWGALGLVWAKVITPELLFRIGEPTTRRQVTFVVILAVYLALDIFLTVACFSRRAARDAGIPAHNAFEAWVDQNFTDQFMSSKFQNLVIDSQGGGDAR